MSRQAFYQGCRRRRRQEVDEDAIVELVKRERRLQPRMGARKLLVLLEDEMRELEIAVGRDRFFELLRERDLLVPRRSRGARTTDSRHGFRPWPNLIRHVEVSMLHQVWVCDLTYVRTEEGFMYLALIMDLFSRKVVGYDMSDSLEAAGCLRALQQALAQLPAASAPIHHSDRGIQYCCGEYTNALEERGCAISMTEVNHCYENANAERLNGILKEEYGLGKTFLRKEHALETTRQAILLYNDRRPHTMLKYQTPSAVHQKSTGRAA
jgi:transposase InsO family protein